MLLVLKILLVLFGIEHLGIAGLEMVASPQRQARTFDMPLSFVEQAPAQTALKNQGIYNAMLGVAMLLSPWLLNGAAFLVLARLLLVFLLVVGLYGGATVTKKIYLVQAVPAVVGLVVSFLA